MVLPLQPAPLWFAKKQFEGTAEEGFHDATEAFCLVFADITTVMELCPSTSICLLPGASLKSLQGLTAASPSQADVL